MRLAPREHRGGATLRSIFIGSFLCQPKGAQTGCFEGFSMPVLLGELPDSRILVFWVSCHFVRSFSAANDFAGALVDMIRSAASRYAGVVSRLRSFLPGAQSHRRPASHRASRHRIRFVHLMQPSGCQCRDLRWIDSSLDDAGLQGWCVPSWPHRQLDRVHQFILASRW